VGRRIALQYGRAYTLTGLTKELWDNSHPVYGTPTSVAGRYIGFMRGKRRWHGFEIWVEGQERGVIFMPDEDLFRVSVAPLKATATNERVGLCL
jgi:hypothetical protein